MAASLLASAVVATIVVAASATAAAASASATAAHHAGHFGQFFVGCFAAGHHFAYKVQVASCIRMVEVYRYFVCADGCYFAADTFAFGSHEGKNGTHFHVFFVKLAVDVEDFF